MTENETETDIELDGTEEIEIEEWSDAGSEYELVQGVLKRDGEELEFRLHGTFEYGSSHIFDADRGMPQPDETKWSADLTVPVNFEIGDDYAKDVLGEDGAYELAKKIAKKATEKYTLSGNPGEEPIKIDELKDEEFVGKGLKEKTLGNKTLTGQIGEFRFEAPVLAGREIEGDKPQIAEEGSSIEDTRLYNDDGNEVEIRDLGKTAERLNEKLIDYDD